MSETARKRITVLGAGRVGSAMVRDLATEADFALTVVDRDEEALAGLGDGINAVRADLSDPERIRKLGVDADLVISAVPGSMGYETLKAAITAGRNVVDISFFAEDPFGLDDLARRERVTAVVDCGVAPGLSNVIAGRMHARLERMDRYICYVGGLPTVRIWPFEYQAGFSPADVIAEYTRPARFVADGEEVIRPALSDPEFIELPDLDLLEAFNTDGLRTLAKTLDVPHMIEKTLRYPGHATLMRAFRETGLFDEDSVEVDGQTVRPIDLTSKLLFDKWRMAEGDEDLTVMRVIVEGVEGGERVRHTFDLLDRYDRDTKTTSMARTTGYTATVVARQVVHGSFAQVGICPPEFLGRSAECYDDLLAGLAKRGVTLATDVSPA